MQVEWRSKRVHKNSPSPATAATPFLCRSAVTEGGIECPVQNVVCAVVGIHVRRAGEPDEPGDTAVVLQRHRDFCARVGGTLRNGLCECPDAVSGFARYLYHCWKTTEATRALETVRTEASHYGYAAFELEARLHLGEGAVRSGKATAGRARLEQLRDDARNKGFLLIAGKASVAMNDPSRPLASPPSEHS